MFRKNQLVALAPLLPTFFLSLTLLLLPFQFGKHFWPSFSYVDGQRIDYLSVTIYASDICIFLLVISKIIVSFLQKQEPRFLLPSATMGTGHSKSRTRNKKALYFLGVFLYLSVNIFFSQSPLNGWYVFVKLLEYAFFVWCISTVGPRISVILLWTFCINTLLEGFLAIMQFFHQGSIGGLWYFLGERTFSAVTPGIANASIHGQLILRPYATFPHPNVLAGYLVIALLFLLAFLFSTKSIWQRILSTTVVIFGCGILFLTLSRVAIGIFIILSVGYLLWRFSQLKYWILVVGCFLLVGIFLSSSLVSGRFLDASSYSEAIFQRDALTQSAWWMFVSHPVLGVGLENFLPSLPSYMSPKFPFGFLQPVHNIFLLVLAETGIVGLGIFIGLLFFAYKENIKELRSKQYALRRKNHNFLHPIHNSRKYFLSQFALLSLVAICCIGLTDHYFLTLQQGQLLSALVLGISFSRSSQETFHKK